MIANASDAGETELQKLRFDFAWKHFQFHAQQRITMFQYFSTLVPLMAGGYFFFLKENLQWQHQNKALIAISAIGVVLSAVFLLLDIRNRQLYQISENNLYLLERQYLYKSGLVLDEQKFTGIINTERELYGRGILNALVKFRLLLPCLYITAGAMFSTMLFHAITLR